MGSVKEKEAASTSLREVSIPQEEQVKIIDISAKFAEVEVLHKSIYADPFSLCEGSLVAKIRRNLRGYIEIPCQKCGENVHLSATQILVAIKKFRVVPLEKIQELATITGIHENNVETWANLFEDTGNPFAIFPYLQSKAKELSDKS